MSHMYYYVICRESSGSPLQIRFSTGISLLNCVFQDNRNLMQVEADTDDTTITDIYDIITTSGGLTVFTRGVPIEVTIRACNFSSNTANTNPANNTRPVLLKANGHGGAILLRLVEANDSIVRIEDCRFENNFAEVDGGAVYMSLSEFSHGNTINLTNNVFLGNRVEEASGGAVSINSFNFSSDNHMFVSGCNFSGSYGDSGGAFSFALYNSNVETTRAPDLLQFNDCMFMDNQAKNEGTAVGLFSLVHVDQVGFPVYFQDW